MDNIVEVRNAYKSFKETQALSNVNVNFERGKIHGIIGRNGSGKTVLFKCICGFMTLTSGEIIVNGKKVKPSVSQNIGIILETPGFIGSLSGYKNLKLLADIHKKVSDDEIKETLLKVGLDPQMKKHVRKYSLGMRHRLGIAQAIMEKPELLILDEPMNGLDKHGVTEMRALFKDLNKQGVTIILSSHYSEDIDALCDTVCEMDAGKLTQIR
ncbi:ABC transporter ATP-binding protein [Acetivibrio mesophilus]|mgnify:CR=1 FL=1|uniref:ABC transporter ATP-binding protein n=1 Tax=Acetivibrio mesophilus TaxID=2487273 RepID=A0A4Q0I3W7_9FIRM|nr:ABC transporter ATP-binding protein [Acetivibrio mesophilus]ODM27765.1 multidrug ABC transporter ATP-binding protein [Clostridium sp. Bc-iso-3]RXE58970.1 ABC transporter ATP-binding protein [Acetivibrio mesophilus]HHV29330.1 ABC transporter ATP-binding protein [Clostridium sp.]